MPQDSTDQPWRLAIGNHPQFGRAAGTDLDVDRIHSFEALHLTHQCRGQWLLRVDCSYEPHQRVHFRLQPESGYESV